MGAEKPYFQFPLSLLAFGADVETRLRTIVAYAIVTTGRDEYVRLTRKEAVEIAEQIPMEARPRGLRLDSVAHISIALGRKILGVVGGSVVDDADRFSIAEEFLRADKEVHGPAPIVRVLSRYAWEVINGTGMDYRGFSVLCAIYCVIGRKAYPVLITRDRIRAAALGYKSPKMLFDELGKLTEAGEMLLAKRTDGARPLTLDQARWTIEKLRDAGHFAKASPNARQTYFSHRMTAAELGDRLLKWKTRPAFKGNVARTADQELQAKIKAANLANGKSPRSPHYHSVPALIDGSATETADESTPHVFPAVSPQTPRAVPTGVPTLTETSSQKLLLVETDLTETLSSEGAGEDGIPAAIKPTVGEVSLFFQSIRKMDASEADEKAVEWLLAMTGKPIAGDWKQEATRFVLKRASSA